MQLLEHSVALQSYLPCERSTEPGRQQGGARVALCVVVPIVPIEVSPGQNNAGQTRGASSKAVGGLQVDPVPYAVG